MAFIKGSDGIARSLKENKDVTYRYADSDVATLLSSFGSNTVVTTGNVTAGNFIGEVTGNVSGSSATATSATTAGTVTTAAQANITSVGTLTSVIVTGNVAGGNITTAGAVEATGLLSSGTTITAIGNVVGGNITTAGVIAATGNITGGNLLATGNIVGTTNGFDIGYLEIPQVALSANAIPALDESGKHFYSTTAGNVSITIPSNANVAFPIGSASTVVVNAAGNVIVDKQAGVSLYLAGNSTDSGRVVSTYGMATIMKVATDVWFISGSGVA